MNNFKKRLHKVIPGGAHTYSRGDDQFPDNAPPIFSKGKGSYLWDPNSNKYLDYGMGLRSVNIGYGNQEIADAVYEDILNGNNLTRASITELEAAELLTDLIDSADMVKFAKHGSTVTTAAVKMARAFTGKKYIAYPEQHPFFSFDDWFIGKTPMSKGTLNETSDFTISFKYNNIESLEALFERYPNQIAAVILEPATSEAPCVCKNQKSIICNLCPNNENNFLKRVRDITKKNDTLLILDEMITGFRWHLKGGQHYFDIDPDLSTFGKAMANGFAVSALVGKKEIMEIAGINDEGKERIFLTSTTHGAEMGSLRAFIKTVEIIKRDSVIEHIWSYGEKLIYEFNKLSNDFGIGDYVFLDGYNCSPNITIKDLDGCQNLSYKTLFLQEMIKNKVIMPYVAISFSHDQNELDQTISSLESTFSIMAKAYDDGINKYLKSKVIKPVFRKYN